MANASSTAVSLSSGEAFETPTGAIASQNTLRGGDLRSVVTTDRAITVEDVARYSVMGDPGMVLPYPRPRNPGLFSPDGKRVAVVVRSGNPEQGTNDAVLLVYETRELLTESVPAVVARFSSTTNYEPIALVRWLADSVTLTFVATEGSNTSQVYRVNTVTQQLEQVTHVSTQLLWYDILPDGNRVVSLREQPSFPQAQDVVCKRRGCKVTAPELWRAESGAPQGPTILSVHDLPSGRTQALPDPSDSDESIGRCDDFWLAGRLSPDGRFALRACKPRRWPTWWMDYSVGGRPLASCLQRGNICGARRLVLIDLEAGSSLPVGDAPVFSSSETQGPLWIDGGRRFIVAAAMESLLGADETERARRAVALRVLLVDVRTGEISSIAILDSNIAGVLRSIWDEEAQILTLHAHDAKGRSLPVLTYRRERTRWQQTSIVGISGRRDRSPSTVELAVRQSLVERPVLIATDLRAGATRQLLDPNSWLSERDIGYVEQTSWSTRDGSIWQGALYYPPHYQRGTRYPLVIQTHGFTPNEFSLTGGARNFAGRALSAHGIVVLQINENYDDGHDGPIANTPREWTRMQSGYEGAIDHLDRLRIVCRQRVGIQGWSRTGSFVGYVLARSSYPIAASAFTDSGDFGWWGYLLEGAKQTYEPLMDGTPLQRGGGSWRNYSPTFNLDRVHTPMLMWQGRGRGIAGLYDWYAGLRRLDRAVEYWVLPDGEHDVFQIHQRISTNHLLVDWFRFWLKDEEDANVLKLDQYVRWRRLRKTSESRVVGMCVASVQ